jgi:hypothetical protein
MNCFRSCSLFVSFSQTQNNNCVIQFFSFLLSLSDISSCHSLGDAMNLPEGKGAHFIALLKSVQLRTHTKQAMEQQVSDEDYAHNREAIQAAKNLFPEHESVRITKSVDLLVFS